LTGEKIASIGIVPIALLDAELHRQRGVLVERCDVVVGVEDLDAGGELDVTCSDVGRAGHAQVDGARLFVLRTDHELFEVEDDVRDVLGHPFDRGELVQHSVDLHLGDSGPRDGREKSPAQRVAQRVAEAGLQRLDGELLARLRDLFFRDLGALNNQQIHGAPLRWY
jgi:hypothetical protein